MPDNILADYNIIPHHAITQFSDIFKIIDHRIRFFQFVTLKNLVRKQSGIKNTVIKYLLMAVLSEHLDMIGGAMVIRLSGLSHNITYIYFNCS